MVTDMSSREPLPRGPAAQTYHFAPAVALDADFDTRWAAWVARGRAHERLVRRKLIMTAGVLASAAAIFYVLMQSGL